VPRHPEDWKELLGFSLHLLLGRLCSGGGDKAELQEQGNTR
jgi:hypothetical protein